MSDFEAVPVELQACGSLLSGIEQELTEKLKFLSGEMDSLLSTGWQGSAADGFAEGWAQWSDGATRLIGALETTAKLLGRTGRMYDGSDEDARTVMWQAGEGV